MQLGATGGARPLGAFSTAGARRLRAFVHTLHYSCVSYCTSGSHHVDTAISAGLSVGRYFDTIVVSRYRFGRYRYRGPDDTFWYHDTTEYRDIDDDTCHELKRICSEMITVAPTQVHKQHQRTFNDASQCFTVSKFHLGVILSSSIATVDTAQKRDVIVDRHLTMSMHVSSVCRAAY